MTVSQRYHFSLMSVVAATVPVNIVRGQKMRGLTRELGLEPAGTIESVDRDELVAGIAAALRDRHALLTRLARAACDLRDRARRNNLWFSQEFHGF